MKTLISCIPKNFRDKYRSVWHLSQLQSRIVLGKLKRQIKRPQLPKLERGKIYLHLGCGTINHQDFVNIDGLPLPHIHYIREIDNLSIFANQSVDLIYASHCLEHFPHPKVMQVLTEWYRVLRKDGILRLSVPDFDSIIKIYQYENHNIDSIQGFLMGGQDYKYNYHMTVFNKSSLQSLLLKSGFKTVQEWYPGTDRLNSFNDCSGLEYPLGEQKHPISLNLEAIKG